MASLQRWFGVRPDWQIILFLILLTVILRLATFHIYPYPIVYPSDSIANMLGAHTFAQGRLTNPPAPWNELFVLDYPTRMMKYQPAMAGFMALGIKLFGHPHWGVVLLMSLAIAAGYWALRGWLPKKTAFTGALILMLTFQAPHYWIWSYWGGGHILLASFLMLGAYPRVILQHRYHAIILGFWGGACLIITPFRGWNPCSEPHGVRYIHHGSPF